MNETPITLIYFKRGNEFIFAKNDYACLLQQELHDEGVISSHCERLGGIFMGVVDKIEDLVFQSRSLSSVEILKDRYVIVKMRCIIEKLSETACYLVSVSGVRYKIYGTNLQIKEYGDTYVKVMGDRVKNFVIEGDENE